MSSHVLGISAFYHDAAAALVRDGKLVAAVQEERFSRKKHDPRLPKSAINYCLEEAFIEADDLDAVVFYDNSLLTLERALCSIASGAANGNEVWMKSAPTLLGVKPFIADLLRKRLGIDVPILFAKHHTSHAASAFYPSPFDEAAVLTVDGVGEWATTSIHRGSDVALEAVSEIRYPHSLGLLYSAFTYFTGFKVNSGEYKLMGLAPYGEPRYVDLICDNLIELNEDGSFRLNLEYFGYIDSNRMTNAKFDELFGGPPRTPEARIGRREMDIAASIQKVTETAVLGLARRARETTGCSKLCLAGGVALNCVANGELLREGIFEEVWIQPAAGDAGGAVGAALLASYQKFGGVRALNSDGRDRQQGSYLGPRFGPAEVKAFLDRESYPYHLISKESDLAARAAKLLAQGKVVGLLHGRMEFGPRSLGGRSILGDPRSADTQTVMNLKIKYRESFRPFAPSVLRERMLDFFDLDVESPYMLLVAPVKKDRCLPFERDPESEDLLAMVRAPRSDIPAVTHIDYSARVQSVDGIDHPFYHRILSDFESLTGFGVLVNTSFNVRGEPIVCSPQDAYRCFQRTAMDALILENCLLLKDEQPEIPEDDSWKEEYELD
jgi:carbamoyltransferase